MDRRTLLQAMAAALAPIRPYEGQRDIGTTGRELVALLVRLRDAASSLRLSVSSTSQVLLAAEGEGPEDSVVNVVLARNAYRLWTVKGDNCFVRLCVADRYTEYVKSVAEGAVKKIAKDTRAGYEYSPDRQWDLFVPTPDTRVAIEYKPDGLGGIVVHQPRVGQSRQSAAALDYHLDPSTGYVRQLRIVESDGRNRRRCDFSTELIGGVPIAVVRRETYFSKAGQPALVITRTASGVAVNEPVADDLLDWSRR